MAYIGVTNAEGPLGSIGDPNKNYSTRLMIGSVLSKL